MTHPGGTGRGGSCPLQATSDSRRPGSRAIGGPDGAIEAPVGRARDREHCSGCGNAEPTHIRRIRARRERLEVSPNARAYRHGHRPEVPFRGAPRARTERRRLDRRHRYRTAPRNASQVRRGEARVRTTPSFGADAWRLSLCRLVLATLRRVWTAVISPVVVAVHSVRSGPAGVVVGRSGLALQVSCHLLRPRAGRQRCRRSQSSP